MKRGCEYDSEEEWEKGYNKTEHPILDAQDKLLSDTNNYVVALSEICMVI